MQTHTAAATVAAAAVPTAATAAALATALGRLTAALPPLSMPAWMAANQTKVLLLQTASAMVELQVCACV